MICCSLGHCESGQAGPAVASGDATPRVKGRALFKSGLFHPVGAVFRGEPEQRSLLLLLRISGDATSPPRSWRLISPGARGVLGSDTIGRFDTRRSGHPQRAAAEMRCSAFPVPWNLPGPAARSVPPRLISSYCCSDAVFCQNVFFERKLHPSWLLFLKGGRGGGMSQKAGV